MQPIFGIGAGRNGSKSLSYILNQQILVRVGHETRPMLTWNIDKDLLKQKLIDLENRALKRRNQWWGDVGFYYLWYLVDIFKLYPTSKIIYITRNVDETVKSYINKVTKRSKGQESLSVDYCKNFWQDGVRKYRSGWDVAYPKFNECKNLEEAVRAYCLFYKNYAEILQKSYYSNFITLDVNQLNRKEGLDLIFDFIGLKDREYFTGVRMTW